MIKQISLFLLFGCLCTNAIGQATAKPDTGTEAKVATIKASYKKINESKLKVNSIAWDNEKLSDCPPVMGGTAIFYSLNNKVVKVVNNGGEDHGEWKEEYYFSNGKLFFIYQNNAYGGAANPTEYKYQNRYYIDGDKVIKAIESKDKANEETIAGLIQTAYRLHKAKTKEEIARIMSCPEQTAP